MTIQRRFVLGSGGLALCAASSCIATGAQPAGTPAHWQEYEAQFAYMGQTTLYSCNGLEDRLKNYLLQLGARKDLKVSAIGCGAEPVSRMISARIHASLPLEGEAADPKDSFVVVRKTVQLKSKTHSDQGAGDCELLEQVRDRLLPDLKLTSVGDDLRCIPGQPSLGSRSLNVPAWVVAPAKAD